MASKKYKLLLIGVFALFSISSIAQQGGTYDVYDSTVVPKKGMAQQNEFWNNTYSFPAKPRNMWEIGISIGSYSISGDVPARVPSFGGAIHVQKALGYVFAIRAQYTYGIAKGLAWDASSNFAKNPAWAGYSAPVRIASGQLVSSVPGRTTFDKVFYNYKSTQQVLDLDGVVTLNNIRFHKQKTGFIVYGGAGPTAMAYKTMINAQNDGNGGGNYAALFNGINLSDITYSNRKNIIKTLKAGMDKTYETPAESQGIRRAKLGDNTLRFGYNIMGGIAFKLGKRINIALEDKFIAVKDDLLDGQRWQESPTGDAATTGDFDLVNYLSLGLNFNLGAKSVEPLWWINPLDYAYSELNNPRHMKLPKPTFDDADGDGVLDQLDKEPNTPAGCPVDTHGVTRDTDGDGVPDCKDKQLITPTECQPVDADGVGKCPPPACCADLQNQINNGSVGSKTPTGCTIGDLPSISFKGNTTSLSADAKAMLSTVAAKMKNSPTCNVVINGYPSTNKARQAACNKRTDAIKQYLVEKEGISADRVSANCDPSATGDANTYDLKSTTK